MPEVRVASPADLDAARQCWRRANVARGKVPGVQRFERVGAKLADPAALVVVAIESPGVVGMAQAEPGRVDDGALDPGLCHVSMVFVDPGHWGRGIGGQLLDAVAEAARARGHQRLQLWTGTANERALRLYHHNGFRETGRTHHLATGEPIVQLARDIECDRRH
jgi:GNAT superfamily N-acetyltransferase